jgi:hypothetical protein
MEMGNGIFWRLFAAIELRSVSSGGLNTIIATLLTRAHCGVGDIHGSSGMAGGEDMIRSFVSKLC